MYKLNGLYSFDYATNTKTYIGIDDQLVIRVSDGALIPTINANTDYQTFRKEVLAGAELQDADGNVMTQAEVDAFIATLP